MVAPFIIDFASLALLAGTSSGDLAQLQLQDRNIRLSDLVAVGTSDGNPVIARVPRGTNTLELSEADARRIIRNRLPLAQVDLAFEDSITLVAPPPASTLRTGKCFVAESPIGKDEFITAALVTQAPCESGKRETNVGYDREARVPIAGDDIEAGEYLGAVRPVIEGRIAKGREVQLVTGAGPVTISRSVTTVQTAREGSNVFIRTNDGEVFPAPVSHIVEDKAP